MIRVDTSCCSRFHIFDQASQLQKKNILNNLIHCHPKSHLKRYNIDHTKSINNPILGYINYSGRYLPNFINNFVQKQVTLNTDSFIKKTLMRKKNKPDIFIGLSSFITKTVKYCNQNSIYSIVDHGSLHPEFEKKLIIDECNRISINYNDFIAPNWQIERMRLEFNQAKKIIVLSEIAKQSMIDYGTSINKIEVLNCGVDQNFFKPSKVNKFDKFTIAYCGSLSPRKGLHNLIEAFKRSKINNSQLVILGSKSISKDYNRLLKKISGENIIFYGSVKQNKLTSILSKCHVFVLPSIADGFGLVVLQAISAGLPVIVSSNVGSSDLIKKYGGGYVFKYNDIDKLTGLIVNFYTNKKDLLSNFNLDQVINNITWENYGNRLYNFLRKL